VTERTTGRDGPAIVLGPPEESIRLAEAKLAAPRQRAGMVLRPRVLGALDAAVDASLTLSRRRPGTGRRPPSARGVRAATRRWLG